MINNDVELIHRILDGDDTAFSDIVNKYQKQVHALVWRKIGDFHIAEEITQDTFLKAYQKLADLKKPHCFAGWLYVIATRCCQAWLRKKQIQTESLDELDDEALEPEAYSQYVTAQKTKTTVETQRQVVKKLLATLPESERTVITLYYFGEMTCEKISEFLGVSANTIKSRLRRARNRLKQEEPMIREAITNFKISPNLTDNILQEIAKLKPTAPSTSKPFVPWIIGASSAVLVMLLLGTGSQYLARFQLPYSLEAQSETTVELVDAQIVQNLEVEPIVRNQMGERSDFGGRNDSDGRDINQVTGDQDDYTRWKLPEGAKRRLGKGVLTDMKVSPDGTYMAIASSTGIWLYDTNQEGKSNAIALLTDHKGKVRQLTFSPDSNMFASIGNDKTIRLWETSTGKHLFTLTTPKPTGEFHSVKFIRDGKTLAGRCWDDYRVYLWDATTGKYLDSFRPKLPIIRLGQDSHRQFTTDTFFDPIGNITFAIGNKDGTISIQEGRTGMEKVRLVGQTDETQYFKVNREHDSLNPRKPTVRRTLIHLDDKPTIPKQLKADGTPYPIQYLLSAPNYSSSTYEKQPTKWIYALEFSPDGKILISKSQYRIIDGTGYSSSGGPTEIWDIDTGEQIASLALNISDVIFSGDGKTLAITGSGGVSVWDIATRQEIGVFNDAVKVVFSGDGNTLCIIEHDRYRLWDTVSRSEIKSLTLKENPFEPVSDRFELTYDGSLLATTDKNGVANIWETRKNTKIRTLTTGFTDSFTALAFAHDGKTLVSGNSTGKIELWDLNTNSAHFNFKMKDAKDSIDELLFSAEESTILTVISKKDLMLWDIIAKKAVHGNIIPDANGWSGSASMSDGTSMRVTTLSFSSNGKRLATKNSENKKVDVWDITVEKEPNHLTEIEHKWGPVGLSPDGLTLASASLSDNGIDLWNANSGELLTKLDIPKKVFVKFNNITALAFSHDAKILAGGTGKNEIHLWDFDNYKHIGILKAHKHPVCSLDFSPDNTILASGDTGGGICLWVLPDRKLLSTYKSPAKGYISDLAFSPDGKTLASTSGSSNFPKTPGGTIFLWDVPSK
ncbi:MAG: sigma-70 family RNA polymerase sigma factor [Candidatus Poribacteria bacterium]|nr:sigma-70 family RNA polymerase sigma factor [Candidatus Poribacteria bacterium]